MSLKNNNRLVHFFNNPNSFYIINIFILFLGLIGFYFENYLLTLYSIVHFFVLFLQKYSTSFAKSLENYNKDQIIIRNHYLENFKFFYYLVLVIRLITFFYYFYFLTLSIESINKFSDIINTITYIFILISLIDLVIILYIILNKNHSGINVAENVCYHFITKGIYIVFVLHISSNVIFVEPNAVINWYQINSPLGRGYGFHTYETGLQIDHIKSILGKDFDPSQIIDEDRMVDPKKLKEYAKFHSFSDLGNEIDHFKTLTRDIKTLK